MNNDADDALRSSAHPTRANKLRDIFVYDQLEKKIERVSVDSFGNEVTDRGNTLPSISADGRYVAFRSSSAQLVEGDTNKVDDVFIYDREMRTTKRITIGEGKKGGDSPMISADGKYLVFGSSDLLFEGQKECRICIYLRNLESDTTTLVAHAGGFPGHFERISISGDGRFIAFKAYRYHFFDNAESYEDIFVYDRDTDKIIRASVNSNGDESNSGSFRQKISTNGRYVVFQSAASNLIDGDDQNKADFDIFIRDLQTKKTTLVSVDNQGNQLMDNSYYPSISGDGRYVTFTSYDYRDLVSQEQTTGSGLFIYDVQTGKTTLLPKGNNSNTRSSINKDGRYIAFISESSDLVESDTNHAEDIFIYDREGQGM